MDAADRNYFLDRVEEELTLANQATHSNVARAHYHLAAYYLDRVYGGPANENDWPEPAIAQSGPSSPFSTLPSVER
ncbi:hypothetical protein GCM10023232_09310 [Sphingosinicella ginsenosidimutans]|jgi:hypothetical protein|uniref:Uncharacterized protein n=1 Tax=Allosphingosinicella ginsenosidimutans TaxID=1176539 RepID=A0A5C6TWA4_9SPHN|nr:hypothetical protein [Sphingosinicella ginsenosidimutans]TXC64734.1 hypothetical protein FRZ32_14410 [Sphingosinicella ginsenosidimutans]